MKTQIKGYKIRKWYECFEETLTNETGKLFDNEPLRKFAVGAVLITYALIIKLCNK